MSCASGTRSSSSSSEHFVQSFADERAIGRRPASCAPTLSGSKSVTDAMAASSSSLTSLASNVVDGAARQLHHQQQPSPAPRSSSYMLMLNSFASDLDSILSDLSTSPTLRGSHELMSFEPTVVAAATSPPRPVRPGSIALSAASCPDLAEPSNDVTDGVPSANITLLERLIRSHPIWYLPSVQRLAAAQLLQNQEQGVFITRQSSQPGTLALSVKLTPHSLNEPGCRLSTSSGTSLIGAGVQHYLIEATESPTPGVRLESSDFVFDNLPALLAHYCQCCDELPVQLRLPAKIRHCPDRASLTSLAMLGQDFWNSGENILTIPAKRAPPVPPLRLSTFDPFGSQLSISTPTTPVPPVPPSHSPRLEARGTEPVPPPPPPRWCKPQLVPLPNIAPIIPSHEPSAQDTTESTETTASHPPPTPTRPESSRKPVIVRRRKPRRSHRSSAPLSPHCHHSSLADKASDYEDIWATSPGASQSEDDDHPVGRRSSSPNDDAPLIDLDAPDIFSCKKSESGSSRSSTLSSRSGKDTSVSSLERRNDSRSLTSSPENVADVDLDRIEPPEAFQQPKEEEKEAVTESIAVTVIEVKSSPPPSPRKVEVKEEDKENQSDEVPLRRRTSNSSSESREETNSRRTSPLYSEPADALPPEIIAQITRTKIGRPLPVPPLIGQQIVTDVSTFTKDGYVRCTLPALTQSSPPQKGSASLPPVVARPNGGLAGHPKSKQVALPKPPVPLPAPTTTSPAPSENRRAFPSLIYLPPEDSITIQEVLAALYPSANLSPPSRSPVPSNATLNRSVVVVSALSKQRVSAYDNLLSGSAGDLEEADRDDAADDSSDDGTVTEFSEPWDSARWDRLLASPHSSVRATSLARRSKRSLVQQQKEQHADDFDKSSVIEPSDSVSVVGVPASRPPSGPTVLRNRSFKDKMDPLLASPRLVALRSTCNSQAGRNLQVLVNRLGKDCTTTFGRSLQNFLQCTREAKEQRASAVLRNVRQFISGIKNFLVQHGETAFDSALLDIRSKLKSNEFLNVDVVLEVVLHQLVTLPLRSHLYKLLGQEALAAGSVQQLLAGIRVAREIDPASLGLKEGQLPPPDDVVARASASMDRLQRAASPLDKLEQLLDACTVMYNYATEACGDSVAAEDFLPLLAWLIAHCGFATAEMEADYMWALLQPSLLAGEGGYFLTALSSAAQLLKNLHSRPASPSDCGSWMGTLTSIPEGPSCAGSIGSSGVQQPCVLRVLVADENQSSLLARTVPLRPSMTVRDVTKLLALKLRLSNPQDFTLVALIDGQEIQLPETENPQTWILGQAASTAAAAASASSTSGERPCTTFAFRRQDAKIAWPRQINV